ncbi:MAG: hypothetical protein KDG89_14915 [Geminicoccaceae bacterium]|nr:hypothetical protein [Geminicoccaceae bacterium]
MRTYATLGTMRRQRRRRLYLRAAAAVGFLLLLFLFAVSGYHVGLAQNRVEVERAEATLEEMQASRRRLLEAAAASSQREGRMRERVEAVEAAYARDVPNGEPKRLLDLVEQKIAGGVPPERLALILGHAGTERACARGTETKRLTARTPIATTVDNAVTFADNRITVSGEGQMSQDAQGVPEPWFDPAQPVKLHFLTINGDVDNAEGRLPLQHAVVLGDREYLFVARSTDRRGIIELTAQDCAFP